jgi:hypothetical protein
MYFKLVQNLVFKLFLISVFFFYYQFSFLPGSPHTFIMLLGLTLLLPSFHIRLNRAGVKLSFDYLLILLIATILIVGFFLNFKLTSGLKLQAYFLMLLTYVYVKESTKQDTIRFILKLCKVFILVNGTFLIIQTLTGDFFPARYLAAGDPHLRIASGVSDGATKNGFLVLFCLSALFANFICKNLKFTILDFSIFLFGIISLALSASRAGIISFIAVVFVGTIFSIIQNLRDKQFRIRRYFYLSIIFFFGGIISLANYFNLDWKLLYELSNREDTYGLNVIVYKSGNFFDDSTAERLSAFKYMITLLEENPLYYFAAGMGAGTFERLNGINIHNSWLELIIITGIYGFSLFIILNAYILIHALRNRYLLLITPMIFSLFSMMIFMLAHDILRGRIYWIALGIIAGYVSISQKSTSLTKQLRKLS